ncbi:MAG: transglycosylase SLT domain-containing protein [Candidatus Edwardsbacteria bacterium]|nr:transglycosylase SLT domain-containing protein [Candidatus Edwardsbacteria bacterium]
MRTTAWWLAAFLSLAAALPAQPIPGRLERAGIMIERREYADALALLDSIGTDSLARPLACRAHLLRGQYQSALLCATEIAILWPETAGGRAALWQAAYASERLGLLDDAIALYRRAAGREPGLAEYAGFRIDRCRVKQRTRPGRKGSVGDLFRPGKGPAAAASPTAGSTLSPGTAGAGKRPYALKLAARHVKRKRYEAARKLLAGFIAGNPRSGYRGEAAYQIAKGWERQGKLAEAESAYRAAAAVDPASRWADDALFRCGWCQLKMGDSSGALATWEAVRAGRGDADQRAAALYWSASLMTSRGDSAAAGGLLNQLRRSYARSYYGLKAGGPIAAPAADTSGLPEGEPLRPLPAAYDSAPITQDGLFLLARTLAGYGLADDAASAAAAVEPRYARDPRSLYHLARIYADCGNDQRAIGLAQRALSQCGDDRPAEMLALAYPRTYLGAILRHSDDHGLDPAMVLAVIHKESRFAEKSRSRAGARGLMQIMPRTGRLLSGDRRFRKDSLYDPMLSIRFGTRFLARMLDEFGGSWPQALAAYNAGPGRVRQWRTGAVSRRDDDHFLEEIFIPETKRYIMAVMENCYIYRQLLGEERT